MPLLDFEPSDILPQQFGVGKNGENDRISGFIIGRVISMLHTYFSGIVFNQSYLRTRNHFFLALKGANAKKEGTRRHTAWF